MNVDLGPFLVELHKRDHGKFKRLAECSASMLGAALAESFSERVISCVNVVMTEGRTLLDDADLEKIAVLRMNRSYGTETEKIPTPRSRFIQKENG